MVVASATGDPPTADLVLRALERELDPSSDRIVWVARHVAVPRLPDDAILIRTHARANRGEMYQLGLAQATTSAVAFTDATTVPQPGWRQTIAEAMARGSTIVGGPVMPSRPRSALDWAGFLMEYAPHAVAPYTSSTGDVAGNNVAYVRQVLTQLAQGSIWKAVVNERLRRQGVLPMVMPGMCAVSHKRYAWRDLLIDRVRHGRHYAAERSRGWRLLHRAAFAAGCTVLPVVSLWRLAGDLDRDVVERHRLVGVAPLLAVSAVSWSVGEALGYLTGKATTDELM